MSTTVAPPRPPADERIAARSPLQRLLGRPEIGALVGAVVLFVFFAVVAPIMLEPAAFSTVLYSSSVIGIMAVAVALLMIGGEFDLSAGVMVTTSALTASMVSYQLSVNVWVGVLVSLVVTLALGWFNGFLLIKTGLPSFIVTLSTFFMLAGLNLGVTKLITDNVATPSISDIDGYGFAKNIFASDISIGGVAFKITILWWVLFVVAATWLLLRTRAGNWIFAVGGQASSARAVGVPVAKSKIALFMGVAFAAWFSGMHLLFAFNTVQSGEGVGNEFLYIIAAVVGGCLLTGGYGSAVGSAIGALIFGLASKGIVFAEWDPDWFKFFLGAMLLAATVVNTIIRRRAEAAK
jgi:simple sugar transport system permease protein